MRFKRLESGQWINLNAITCFFISQADTDKRYLVCYRLQGSFQNNKGGPNEYVLRYGFNTQGEAQQYLDNFLGV